MKLFSQVNCYIYYKKKFEIKIEKTKLMTLLLTLIYIYVLPLYTISTDFVISLSPIADCCGESGRSFSR